MERQSILQDFMHYTSRAGESVPQLLHDILQTQADVLSTHLRLVWKKEKQGENNIYVTWLH